MNLLLTSIGRRSYIVKFFKEAVENSGHIYVSNSEKTYAMQLADKYFITKPIYDKEYINSLLEICLNNNISAIISFFDIDLPILSKNKALFEKKGIKVVISDYTCTEICNDKWQTYNFLKNLGLPTIKTFLSLETVMNNLQSGKLNFPLIIKPRWGMGSIGIYKVNNESELNVLYNKLNKEIFDTYLKYESISNKEECIIIQEMIIGKEFGLDILNDLNGKFATLVAKEKLAMRAGETDVAITVDTKPFIEIAKKLSENLKHIGNLDIDILEKDGDYFILEMNDRFGGQYPFSHNAGVNFPKQIVEWLNGGANNPKYLNAKIGVKSCKDLLPVIIED